jgi:endoglucanase
MKVLPTNLIRPGLAAVAILAIACGPVSPIGTSSGTSSRFKTVVLGKGESTGKPAPAMPGVNVPAIKVNTVGYPSGWKKIVIFNVDPAGASVKDSSGGVALNVNADMIDAHGTDAASQDPVWQVDLSSLDKPGTYTVHVGDYSSDPFVIGADIYETAKLAGLKSFYFQRTRTALEKPYAVWEGNAYLREKPSHMHDDVGWDILDYPKKKRKWKVEAGWHDAGNFDMYIPSTAPSAQVLLLAYLWNPGAFDDKSLNIPESGNGIPDILDETKWGLDWILSLQEGDGSFRHSESVMEWSPEGPADKDMSERWIMGVSSSATAKAVSVLAVASRAYARWDSAYADRCAGAARSGWEWLKKNPDHIRAKTGGSKQPLWDDEPDRNDVGARFAAAVEMWREFRDKSALESVRKLMKVEETTNIGEMIKGAWVNISRWGLAALALDMDTPDDLREEAGKRILGGADLMMEQVNSGDGYRCASTTADYYWAHNSNLMEKAHIMAVAHKLDPGKGYLAAARDQWHWILGRNPNGYSMTTRVGNGPTRLYHMEWGHEEPPPPGFLLGGPNADNLGFLAPGAPAKAIFWQNPEILRSGVKAGSLWHWQQTDMWDSGFIPEDGWSEGWWAVTESDILYSANFVLVAVCVMSEGQ